MCMQSIAVLEFYSLHVVVLPWLQKVLNHDSLELRFPRTFILIDTASQSLGGQIAKFNITTILWPFYQNLVLAKFPAIRWKTHLNNPVACMCLASVQKKHGMEWNVEQM